MHTHTHTYLCVAVYTYILYILIYNCNVKHIYEKNVEETYLKSSIKYHKENTYDI